MLDNLNELSRDELIELLREERRLKEQAILDLEMLRTAKEQIALEREQAQFERQLDRETILSLKDRLRDVGVDPDSTW